MAAPRGMQAPEPVSGDLPDDATVIGRSLDDPEQFALVFRRHAPDIHRYVVRGLALTFVHHSGVTYPVVADPMPMKAAIAYNLPGLPATFFLNARHIIVKRIYGPVTQAELTAGTRLMAGQSG